MLFSLEKSTATTKGEGQVSIKTSEKCVKPKHSDRRTPRGIVKNKHKCIVDGSGHFDFSDSSREARWHEASGGASGIETTPSFQRARLLLLRRLLADTHPPGGSCFAREESVTRRTRSYRKLEKVVEHRNRMLLLLVVKPVTETASKIQAKNIVMLRIGMMSLLL